MKWTWCLFLFAIPRASGYAVALGASCMAATEMFNYGCDKSAVNYTCECRNPVYMGTVLTCIKNNAGSFGMELESRATINSVCSPATHLKLSQQDFDSIYLNASKYLRTDVTPEDVDQLQTLPFRLPPTVLSGYLQASYLLHLNMSRSIGLGYSLMAYIGLVVLVQMCAMCCYRKFPRFIRFSDFLLTRKLKKLKLKLPIYRRNLSTSSSWAKRVIGRTVPSHARILIVVIYQAIHIAIYFVGYSTLYPSDILPPPLTQIGKFLGYRAGVLAMSQLPLIFLFAGRNWLLMYMTGWTETILMMLHSWICGGVAVDMFIHAVSYGVLSKQVADYAFQWSLLYTRWGLTAVSATAIIAVLSLKMVRTMINGLIWYLHQALAIIFIIAVYYHLPGNGEVYLLWAAISAWSFNHIQRWYLLFYSGLRSPAFAQLRDGGVIELTMSYSRRWTCLPGTRVYLYITNWNKMWRSHSFVVSEALESETWKLAAFARTNTAVSRSAWNYLYRHPHGSADIKVLVEGPYGTHWPLYRYDQVVIMCGGLGITACFDYVMNLKANCTYQQKLVVEWVIADKTPISWYNDYLERLTHDGKCDVRIYVNKYCDDLDPRVPGLSNAEKLPRSLANPLMQPVPLNVYDHAPEINWMVYQHIGTSTGSIAFLVCAPPRLREDIQSAVADSLGVTRNLVDYYEEEFDWN